MRSVPSCVLIPFRDLMSKKTWTTSSTLAEEYRALIEPPFA